MPPRPHVQVSPARCPRQVESCVRVSSSLGCGKVSRPFYYFFPLAVHPLTTDRLARLFSTFVHQQHDTFLLSAATWSGFSPFVVIHPLTASHISYSMLGQYLPSRADCAFNTFGHFAIAMSLFQLWIHSIVTFPLCNHFSTLQKLFLLCCYLFDFIQKNSFADGERKEKKLITRSIS